MMENPEKNFPEQRREPTTQINPHLTQSPGIEPGATLVQKMNEKPLQLKAQSSPIQYLY